ncbi:hypothetical protein BOX15_Mlig002362g2 [Macrostomum lignano]|uniref:BED-type domain-containing protein n=1 Tax=Macrostomum lignano TaxID=282301 RepID=A0A267G036_9PLAT|nr:hypothetical protein BOX15_Mlig002362g2 [Macrostomum lignano]
MIMDNPIWKHFNRVPVKEAAICLSCKAELKTTSSSTTGLWRHLQNKHVGLYETLKNEEKAKAARVPFSVSTTSNQNTSAASSHNSSTNKDNDSSCMQSCPPPSKQAKIDSMFRVNKPWDKNNPSSRAIDRLIVQMIAVDSQPVSIVEDLGFQRLVAGLEPRYELKSRNYYQKLIEKEYELAKQTVKQQLPDDVEVAVTSDCWSSANQAIALLSVTGHFVTQDLERKNLVLAATPIESAHTGEALSNILLNVIEEFQLNDHVTLLLRDGGSNIRKAASLLQVPDASCACHVLQLCVKEALKEGVLTQTIIKKVKGLVGHFDRSHPAQKQLQNFQGALGLPKNRLIQNVETRWNSSLHMLRRYNEQHAAVAAVLSASSGTTLQALTENELDISARLVTLLEPLDEATEQLSRDAESTSVLIPIIRMLLRKLDKIDFAQISSVHRSLINAIKSRFECFLTNEFYQASTALDGRFKLAFFDSSQHEIIKDYILQELGSRAPPTLSVATAAGNEESNYYANVENLGSEDDSHETISAVAESEDQPARAGKTKRLSFLEEFHGIVQSSQAQGPMPAGKAAKVLHDYFANPELLPMSSDPLDHWRNKLRSDNLPSDLKSLIRRYLGAPPTSVPSERLFSKAGRIYEPRRRSLKGENIERLLFLASNMPQLI